MRGNRKKKISKPKYEFGSTQLITTGLTAVNPVLGAFASIVAPMLENRGSISDIDAAERLRDNALESQDRIAAANKQQMKRGGKGRVFDSQNMARGGHLVPISPDASQVVANNPGETDSVELPQAFVDHNEVISKNRVFSDSLKMGGMTIAKQAAKLEKMKSDNPRFMESNIRVDERLDNLFNEQEMMKTKMNMGGKKPYYAKGGGLSRKKDYGSSKKPYPSVKSKDFAGGGRSYPIPTKADAVDALRLAGLHGRSDVKAKVYKKYPGLKKGKQHGGPFSEADLGEGQQIFFDEYSSPSAAIYTEGFGANSPFQTLGMQESNKVDRAAAGLPPLFPTSNYQGAVGSGPIPFSSEQDQIDKSSGSSYAKTNPFVTAAAFAPNIANAFLQASLKGPVAAESEREINFDRISPRAQLAQNTRDYRQAQKLLTSNTAQGSSLASDLGSLLAKRFDSSNQIIGQTDALNAQIQGREALANSAIRGRNIQSRAAFANARSDFSNAKKRLTSQNISSVSNKIMQMGREKKMREKDLLTLDVLSKGYEDSGVYGRVLQPILDKYLGNQ